MDSDNNISEVIYCPEEDEYRIFCPIFDKLCMEG